MSDVAELALDGQPQAPQKLNKRNFVLMLKDLYTLVAPYWRSEEKVLAWVLLGTVFSLNMGSIYCAVLLNRWNASFYNALQELDKDHFNSLLGNFLLLVLLAVVLYVVESFVRAFLSFKWRMWLTKQMMADWLHDSTFYRLFAHKTKTENPDQRISQDLATFTTSTLSLSFSVITQFVKSIIFSIILWTLSRSLLLALPGGTQLNIPGYMLWFTLIYVSFSTFVIYKSGKPLVALDYAQEKVEADFRFSLMRIRERRDEVSILNGAKAENKFLYQNLIDVIKNYKNIIKRNIYVNSFQNLFVNLTIILPILAAAPMFFAGTITLGVLMQIASAFSRVEEALLIFASNFQSFASWKATFNRILDFKVEMADLKHKIAKHSGALQLESLPGHNALSVNNLHLQLADSTQLAHFNFSIAPQERVLLMGRSGMGKSTLIKCIGGLWPFASGSIVRPQELMIIPQKPYFPISTLRDSLLYPNLDRAVSDQELQRVLDVCCLGILKDKLGEVHDWLSILSLGEQQRLNFARVILSKPQWLIMDEPSASMDKALEAKLFAILLQELPNITLLTIGHSHSLKELHTRTIEL